MIREIKGARYGLFMCESFTNQRDFEINAFRVFETNKYEVLLRLKPIDQTSSYRDKFFEEMEMEIQNAPD